jgi:hypothetical protein
MRRFKQFRAASIESRLRRVVKGAVAVAVFQSGFGELVDELAHGLSPVERAARRGKASPRLGEEVGRRRRDDSRLRYRKRSAAPATGMDALARQVVGIEPVR